MASGHCHKGCYEKDKKRKCVSFLQISHILLLLVIVFTPEEKEKLPPERSAEKDPHLASAQIR